MKLEESVFEEFTMNLYPREEDCEDEGPGNGNDGEGLDDEDDG